MQGKSVSGVAVEEGGQQGQNDFDDDVKTKTGKKDKSKSKKEKSQSKKEKSQSKKEKSQSKKEKSQSKKEKSQSKKDKSTKGKRDEKSPAPAAGREAELYKDRCVSWRVCRLG